MSEASPPTDALLDAARWLGLLPAYVDHTGAVRHASASSLLAVAAAVAGVPGVPEEDLLAWVGAARETASRRVVEPVVVLWQPGPAGVPLRRDGDGSLRFELRVDPDDAQRGGEQLSLDAPSAAVLDLAPLELPIGRHRLRVMGSSDRVEEAVVVVAPRRLAGIDEVVGTTPGGRPWGVFAPVWSAWSESRPEVQLGSLDAVGAWVAQAGASMVGTLPLLATFADHPCDPSPYSPVSRRRWSEALIDLRSAPGFDDGGEPRDLAARIVPTDPSAPWDPVAHWAKVRPVLGVLAERARADEVSSRRLLAALEADPELARYAWFRAEVERTGTSWRRWPPGTVPDPGAVRTDPDVWRWAWSQWLVTDQLTALSRRFGERGQSLYLDLALGAHADGFDTWAEPSLYGWGASVGAPPDAMFGGGQDWGFPPQRPEAARASGHAEWSRALRAHLSVCGVLRLDHVLGLQRLFWVPDGAPACEGVYVNQPLEELVAVLAVEAHRAGAAVVGEDLGTVDPAVRRAMATHGVAGMHIAQFAVPADPDGPPQWPRGGQLAAVNTHDMPTFAGWMSAVDAEHRRRAGLIDAAGEAGVRRARAAEVEALRRALGVTEPVDAVNPTAGWQELLAALLVRLGESEADAVLVAVDDLVGGVEQQNVPGTPWSRPNWVVRLPRPLETLAADPWIAAVLTSLEAARRRASPRPEV